MKLPSFRRLFNSDYPKEFQRLIDILSVSLNNGIEVLYNALNNNLTLRDNFKATVKDIIVTVDSSGIPIQTAAFTLNSTSRVEGIIVVLAQNQTNTASFPTSGIFISFNQTTNVINISNITGLQAGEEYLIRVVAFSS